MLLGKVVEDKLQAFIGSNGLMPRTQPAHGTETSLAKVYNDLLLAANNGHIRIARGGLKGLPLTRAK